MHIHRYADPLFSASAQPPHPYPASPNFDRNFAIVTFRRPLAALANWARLDGEGTWDYCSIFNPAREGSGGGGEDRGYRDLGGDSVYMLRRGEGGCSMRGSYEHTLGWRGSSARVSRYAVTRREVDAEDGA